MYEKNVFLLKPVMLGLVFALIFSYQTHAVIPDLCQECQRLLSIFLYRFTLLIDCCGVMLNRNYTSKPIKVLVVSLYLKAAFRSASQPETSDSH